MSMACDKMLKHVAAAYVAYCTPGTLSQSGREQLDVHYTLMASALQLGDKAGFERAWEEFGAEHTDLFDLFAEEVIADGCPDIHPLEVSFDDLLAVVGWYDIPGEPSSSEGFDALLSQRPFSSVETRMVRYNGNDPAIITMMVNQACKVAA